MTSPVYEPNAEALNSSATCSEHPGTSSVDMRVTFCGIEFQNPVTTASGTFASGKEYNAFIPVDKLGAVTTKGVSPRPWSGNDAPRIAETPSGMLNSIGLQNPGVKAFIEHDIPWLESHASRVIVNVSGHSVEEYLEVIDALEECACVDAYELNISCPNVDAGGMAFGTTVQGITEVVSAAREHTKHPLIAKLSPNVTDIAEMARAAEAAGADAISLINTLLGMAINTRTRRPELARVVGGLSGPAVKPVALRMVWQVHQAVGLPIIGMGGIMNAEDAIEFMLAGASMVAVGTANFVRPTTALEVISGIEAYCEREGISQVSELTGALICS